MQKSIENSAATSQKRTGMSHRRDKASIQTKSISPDLDFWLWKWMFMVISTGDIGAALSDPDTGLISKNGLVRLLKPFRHRTPKV